MDWCLMLDLCKLISMEKCYIECHERSNCIIVKKARYLWMAENFHRKKPVEIALRKFENHN